MLNFTLGGNQTNINYWACVGVWWGQVGKQMIQDDLCGPVHLGGQSPFTDNYEG